MFDLLSQAIGNVDEGDGPQDLPEWHQDFEGLLDPDQLEVLRAYDAHDADAWSPQS